MSNPVYKVLNAVESAPTKEEKIYILKSYSNQAVKDVLFGAFDKRIKWALPEGPVPYKPADPVGLDHALSRETRKLYLFAEGGHNTLHPRRREELFVQFLEAIHPEDAKIIVYSKEKKLPFKSITPELVSEAFPDMGLQPVEVQADKPGTKSAKPSRKTAKKQPVQKTKPVTESVATNVAQTNPPEEFVYEEDPVAINLGLVKPEDDLIDTKR